MPYDISGTPHKFTDAADYTCQYAMATAGMSSNHDGMSCECFHRIQSAFTVYLSVSV